MRKLQAVLTLVLVAPVAAFGQQSASTGTQADQDDQTLRLRLPVVTVTAEKVPTDARRSPVSVTAVTRETLESSVPRTVSDAADLAPNTWFNEFSARKLSNPRFRGIGSSPANPGITTFIDGVPQLNANSSSIELADVDQIEFIRGPQSALFGRNSIGGLVSVSSARPSLMRWTGSLIGPFGNFGAAEVRGNVSGPLTSDRSGIGFAFGYTSRDGYTTNDITGNDLDSRSALFTKSQVLFKPSDRWEGRALLTTERARDGDYALNDLGALRANPFHAQRDYEGSTERDIVAPTFLLKRTGSRVDVDSTTGLVWWTTDDSTDLDYTPLPLIKRDNHEEDVQFTQEVRLSSAKDASIALAPNVSLAWQGGVFVFTQGYRQDAVNAFSPFVLSQFVNFGVEQHSPQSELDDRGVGGYGRATFTINGALDLALGVRGDYENKQALLNSFFQPAIAPGATVDTEATFGDVSPQFTAAYRAPGGHLLYATAARGFKAGGFNAAALPGSESYAEEHSWNYEGGVKTLFAGDRVAVNAGVFYILWDDLQTNVPNPFVPGQFYIANAGSATSKGVELELNARLFEGCDFFAGAGYTNATFDEGTFSSGVPVGGHRIANAPKYTADFGGQYSVAVTSRVSAYARAEVVFRGAYEYDDANTERQDAYTISNFRGGVKGKYLFGEAWIRNAFDTRYIPTAFAYPGLAPSGFVGEMGAPRTFGVRAGVTF
jgi:iron complex outermembrane receptor protein